MKSSPAIFLFLVAFVTVISSVFANYGYHKPLEIKHVWHKAYGHDGYGHDGYGHGGKYGKTLVGYSSRYQVMKHNHGYAPKSYGHGGYHSGGNHGYSGGQGGY